MPSRIARSALGRTALGAALLGAVGLGATGCRNSVDITDPTNPTSQTFFKTSGDAQAAVTASYNALIRLGTFERWQGFSYDMRSDEGTSFSPWPELQAFVKFQFPSGYDFDVNRDTWNDTYTLISRTNQVVDLVPPISMDATSKAELVGEAEFLRGLGYFHLMTLYGGRIPLVLHPVAPGDRPASADSAAVWAQIEKDFTAAAAVLPKKTFADNAAMGVGRAVWGSAQGMLGKTLLQERKWAAAATALQPIIAGTGGQFGLDSNYAALFTAATNNKSEESLFEVEMGTTDLCSSVGVCGLNMARMIGPCGPSYCDGRPTVWFSQQFTDPTSGLHDIREDATLFYYKGDTTTVYGKTWADRRYQPGDIFWKKYGEYYLPDDPQSWDANINFRVLRYADVLLMYAEALNEQGQTAAALPYVNQVRARVGLPALTVSDQAGMRQAILHERLVEFGLESQRWLDLGRQNLFADLATLKAHDTDFNNFVPGKSELLPIPQAERNLNPNIQQNPGW